MGLLWDLKEHHRELASKSYRRVTSLNLQIDSLIDRSEEPGFKERGLEALLIAVEQSRELALAEFEFHDAAIKYLGRPWWRRIFG